MKNNILGYDIEVSDQSYDECLDYISVDCRFYFSNEIEQSTVSELKTMLYNHLNKAVDEIELFEEIKPYQTSELIRNEV